jgi:excisionase family DNA binding protein
VRQKKAQEAPMMGTTEAAAIKGVTKQAIHGAIKDGRLPAVQSGKTWLIHRRDLDRLEIIGHRPKKQP